MKPFVTLLKLTNIVCILPILLYAQNDTIPKKDNGKLYFSTHMYVGASFSNNYKPEGAFSINAQFQGEERFGFGVDITLISPRSFNFNLNPPASLIMNYNEGVDEPYEPIESNGVARQDRFRSYSFYISKGIKPRDRVLIDFQAGFSLYQMKQNTYSYEYNPRISGGLASFFGNGNGAPFVLIRRESGSNALDVGAYFRINGIVRFQDRTALEISSFAQLNGKQSFFGIQLGIAFGRKYKLKILK